MTAEPQDLPSIWARVADLVAATLGLHFPPKRLADLQRGVRAACLEMGFAEEAAGLRWLLSRPLSAASVQTLASHLTIGETYFFRDRASLDALSHHVLPALIHSRRNGSRKLRVWCAGCCTGEEAYTLAILLHQLLPDIAAWDVTVVATDINPHFLRKAVAGTYGTWSFRNAPEWLLRRYFKTSDEGRQTVVPEIRRMVKFGQLNLAAPFYQVDGMDLHHMDLVMCRNVLMYFSQKQMEAAMERLHGCLNEEGCLVVGPGEVPATSGGLLRAHFQAEAVEGAILLRKRPHASHPARIALRAPLGDDSFSSSTGWGHDDMASGPAPLPHGTAQPAHPAAVAPRSTPSAAIRAQFGGDARGFANRGQLREALTVCDEWLVQDRLNPVAHYLRAEILMEQGNGAVHRLAAQDALRRALYLDCDFVLAHVALGRLSVQAGDTAQARRHVAHARDLLRQLPQGEEVPGADGQTVEQVAAQVAQTLRALGRGQPDAGQGNAGEGEVAP